MIAALPLYDICCTSMLLYHSFLRHCRSTVCLAVHAALPLYHTLRGIAALKYLLHFYVAIL
jgi:hypothetical protein